MEIVLLILVIILIIGLTIFFFVFNKKIQEIKEAKQEDKSMMMLNQNVQGMQERLDKVSLGINDRLDNAARVIGAVNKELGQVQEIGRQMKDLQDFLRSPKLRGNIGEQILKDLLNQYFPQNYFALQYKFKTGQVVDAVLKTDNGIIGIDSKFPLENFTKMAKAEGESEKKLFLHEFNKDVRKHIKDISRKYILPEENTVDFAIMYVPSEAIYYEIIRSEEALSAYGQENKVLLVSPNSFFYFLKVILMGMQGKKIEEASKKIFMALQSITKDSAKIGDDLGVLNTHLNNAVGAMHRVNDNYIKLNGKIDQVQLLK
ncbi:MAG: DNA recombination protein RmuC [Patescibacteria group bacterium]|jgi:DNA recombination protein RmuC